MQKYVLTFAISATACLDPSAELPPVQIEGEFISYAAADANEICPGTVVFAEDWMKRVAATLGADPSAILPITYYYVEKSELAELCPVSASGASHSCTRREGDRIVIFSNQSVHRHELVHALHLSFWPRRQPILQEGLAETFDDTFLDGIYKPNPNEVDAAIEAETEIDASNVYIIGRYLIYWIIQRHGAESIGGFWEATSKPTTAVEFRAVFEQEFGESLDTMLAETGPEGCRLPTCTVNELQPWVDGRWTTSSPQGCEDESVVGNVSDERYMVARYDFVEIVESGDYEVSLNVPPDWGGKATASLEPCSIPDPIYCPSPRYVDRDHAQQAGLEAGIYRVTTFQFDAGDPSYEVEIRPLP